MFLVQRPASRKIEVLGQMQMANRINYPRNTGYFVESSVVSNSSYKEDKSETLKKSQLHFCKKLC